MDDKTFKEAMAWFKIFNTGASNKFKKDFKGFASHEGWEEVKMDSRYKNEICEKL